MTGKLTDWLTDWLTVYLLMCFLVCSAFRSTSSPVHEWMVNNEVWGSAFILFVGQIVLIVHVLSLHQSSRIYPRLALLFSFFPLFTYTILHLPYFFPSLPLLYLTIRLFLFSITPFSFIFFESALQKSKQGWLRMLLRAYKQVYHTRCSKKWPRRSAGIEEHLGTWSHLPWRYGKN